MNDLKTATVKATGKSVKVYRLKNGNWCDYANCHTQYAAEQKDGSGKITQKAELTFKN